MKKTVKITLCGGIALIVICMFLFFVLTSQLFLKSVVLPIVSTSMDAEISSDYVFISLLKGELKLKKFDMVSNDNSYSIKIGSLDSEISLSDLYNNKITIPYLNINDAHIKVTQEMDEQSLNQSSAEKKTKTESEESESSTPWLFNIKDVNVKKLNFTYEMLRSKKEDSSTLKLTDFNLSVPSLMTGGDGKLTYKGNLEVMSLDFKDKVVNGSLNGTTELKLNQDSYPVYIESNTLINIGRISTPISIKLDKRKTDIQKTIDFSKNQVLKSNSKKPAKQIKINTLGYNRDKAPFIFSANVKNLLLLPIFKAFVKGSYSSSSGMLEEISLNISGTDIENIDLTKNIKGKLKIQVVDLDIPSQIFDFKIAKLIFLPIHVVANLNDYLTDNDILPSQVTNILDISNDVLDGAKNFNFKSGNVDLTLYEGCINIDKFALYGQKGCSVRKMSFSGDVDLQYGLNVKTETNITGIIIPLTIRGTIDNPVPLVKKMVPALIGKTAENLIKSSLDLGKRLGKTAGNFIKNIPDVVTSEDGSKDDDSLFETLEKKF